MKQTPTTPFLQLAKRIDADIDVKWFCCNDLSEEVVGWFTDMFKPTEDVREEYKMGWNAWLSQNNIPYQQDNQFRILILLLAHEVWCDENKITK